MIDCPGVVYDVGDDEVATVLKGVVRAEKLPEPFEFVQPILNQVKEEYLVKTYGIARWDNDEDFILQLAKKSGKLLPKGEPDVNTISIQLINDFQRGKLPWFVPPPQENLEMETKTNTQISDN